MLKKTVIGIEECFDAAHKLTFHKGKCQNLHGHTWSVLIEVAKRNIEVVEDESLKDIEMVMDLSHLRKEVKEVISNLDHKYLNEDIEHPTCENLVMYFHHKLYLRLLDAYSVKITRIKIQEGRGGWAEWRYNDDV